MAYIKNTKSIYYNDVNLIAQPSVIQSRSEVPKELNKIIVSPMSAVVGLDFAKVATDLGLSVCQHKFCDIDTAVVRFSSVKNKQNLFVSIGLNDWDRAKELSFEGATNWLVDCANGYLPQIKYVVYKLINDYKVNRLLIGNVMTDEGIALYKEYSRYISEVIIRVGIAGGSACATSDATGFNRGNITEIMECSAEANKYGLKIAADGGIKNGNYAAKAFGAGSHYIMMGGYFARALESYTWLNGDGTYWGGASKKQQTMYGGVRRHSEGKVVDIDRSTTLPLKELVDELWGGLSSAVSYSGKKSLSDFIGNGVFEVKQNSLPPKS